MPLGQPLGEHRDADDERYLQVRLGGDIHRLDASAGALWSALHHTRPGTSRGIDRGLLPALDLADRGVADPQRDLELLLDLGLVVELATAAPDQRLAFAESYRLLPLQTVLGNSETDLERFALVAGAQQTVTVDAAMREVLVYAPRAADLYATCFVRSGAIGAAEGFESLGEPEAMVEHTLAAVHPLLAAHAAYFDVAIDAQADAEAAGRRCDPASVDVGEEHRGGTGIFPVGYQAGATYVWLGLESVRVRVGPAELELANEQAWLLWTAAHGVATADGIDDSEQAICDSAKAAGARSPIFDLDDQQQRGLVARPEGYAGLVELAATHRLEPLLAGLGEAPDGQLLGGDPGRPVTVLNAEQYAVWRDAHLSASLLDAAYAAGRAGSARDLREYLRLVQLLLLRRAAYLDLVRE